MTRADRLTLVRQLREEGLSQRAIGKRLHVSKDTVRRDIEQLDAEDEPDSEPSGEPDDPDAPQASDAVAEEHTPVDEPLGEPVAQQADDRAPQDAPPAAPGAPLPRRGRPETELVIDLAGWPALRRDLAVLAQTGLSPQAIVQQAVVVLAFGYKAGVRTGAIHPDQPFVVRDMTVGPRGHIAPRTPPAEGA